MPELEQELLMRVLMGGSAGAGAGQRTTYYAGVEGEESAGAGAATNNSARYNG